MGAIYVYVFTCDTREDVLCVLLKWCFANSNAPISRQGLALCIVI